MILKANNNNQLFKDILIIITLIIVGTTSRVILVGSQLQPFPNFELIMVITLLAAIFIRPTLAFIIPISCIFISDTILGNPILNGSMEGNIIIFTYSGFLLICLFTSLNRRKISNAFQNIKLKNIGYAAGLGVGFTLIYDIWTNFGWWYIRYPHTTGTLVSTYIAGIPFMIYHMLSTITAFIIIALPLISISYNKQILSIPKQTPYINKVPVIAITIIFILLSLV
jgi:hypothetical protein